MKRWALIGCVFVMWLVALNALLGSYHEEPAFAFSVAATVLTVFVWGRVAQKWGL